MSNILPFKWTASSGVAVIISVGLLSKYWTHSLDASIDFEKVKWVQRGSRASLPKWEQRAWRVNWEEENQVKPLHWQTPFWFCFSFLFKWVLVCIYIHVCVGTLSHVSSSRTLSTSLETGLPLAWNSLIRLGWLCWDWECVLCLAFLCWFWDSWLRTSGLSFYPSTSLCF